MNRKHFIGSTLSIIAAKTAFGKSTQSTITDWIEDIKPTILPPFLQLGDTIGITSPAGYIALEDIQSAVKKIESWGYQVLVGKTIGKKDFTFGGTDEERRADFQEMLDNDAIKAILCARGGYGLVRIIDQLNFRRFQQHPKWIIGFSDATILHAHVNSNFRIASIHAKMCNSFPADWSTAEINQVLSLESISNALKGSINPIQLSSNPSNIWGQATGELIGGNLKIIETLCGTSSNLKTDGKILFLEDTDEYLYSIDRMFWNLKRSGKLNKIKGLIIGGFKTKPDDPGEEFGLSLEQLVLEKIKNANIPVCFGFPVGHQKHNMALICGANYRLTVNADEAVLEII